MQIFDNTHHRDTWKNKYRRDLIIILQISADAKEFMLSEHRFWRATSEYEFFLANISKTGL